MRICFATHETRLRFWNYGCGCRAPRRGGDAPSPEVAVSPRCARGIGRRPCPPRASSRSPAAPGWRLAASKGRGNGWPGRTGRGGVVPEPSTAPAAFIQLSIQRPAPPRPSRTHACKRHVPRSPRSAPPLMRRHGLAWPAWPRLAGFPQNPRFRDTKLRSVPLCARVRFETARRTPSHRH